MTVSGALLPFTQQGLEKYNDTMTKDYFQSTSHRGQECLKQMLQKQSRMEHLEHSGAKRSKKFQVKCGNCGTTDLHALRHAVHADSYPTVGILSTRRIKRFQDVSDNYYVYSLIVLYCCLYKVKEFLLITITTHELEY